MVPGRLVGVMVPNPILAAAIVGIVVTAGAGVALVDFDKTPENPAAPAAIVDPAMPRRPSFNLSWNGYYKLGLADCAMIACPAHTHETEPLVEPLAKAGVRVDIPANTTVLEFELRWKGNEQLHLMIHAPMKSDHSMPSYMAMGGAPGRLCLSVPAAQIVPGMWELMAHAGSMGYQDTTFTIHANGEGGPGAKVRSGPHGHPVQEDWKMEMKQGQACRVP
ncbi:MAG: hypothetical protein HYT80_09325 [Euryarchaeota archaeon]|nr:hypothetical protein [Euryarchaeota archaeon]